MPVPAGLDQLTLECLQAELFTLQEQLHDMDDNSGREWVRGRSWVDAKKRRMRDILVELGEDTATMDAALDIVASASNHPRVWTPSLDEPDWFTHPDTLIDFEVSLEPLALTEPGPDGRHLMGPYLTPVLVYPPPKGADADDGGDFTDNPPAVGEEARRGNLLYHLFTGQRQRLVGKVLAEPIDDLHTFAHWMFVRLVLYGFNRIRNFETLLRERYPQLKPINAAAVKSLARSPRDVDITRDGKVYHDYAGALGIEDAQSLVSLLYHEVPHSMAVVGAITEAYCDAVRASRPPADRPEVPDLPELVPAQHQFRFSLDKCRQRVVNLKALVGNNELVGRALASIIRSSPMFWHPPDGAAPRRSQYSPWRACPAPKQWLRGVAGGRRLFPKYCHDTHYLADGAAEW